MKFRKILTPCTQKEQPGKKRPIARGLLSLGTIALFLIFLSVGAPGNAPAQITGATITVNSSADVVTTFDDVLTLREAIMLSEGTLDPGTLSDAERSQVVGQPGFGKSDTILFSVDIVNLTNQLPTISDNDTTIRGPVVLDGSGTIFQAMFVNAARVTIENVDYQNFSSSGINILSVSNIERKFQLKTLKFMFSPSGILAEFDGTGEVTFDLSDSVFKSLTFEGVLFAASAKGTYSITNNRFEKEAPQVGAKLILGQGLGDIIVNYTANKHFENKTGTEVEERQHTGSIQWNFKENLWQGGDVGLKINAKLDGQKILNKNEFKDIAQVGLDFTANPFDGIKIESRLTAQKFLGKGTGGKFTTEGEVKFTWEFMEAKKNQFGIDFQIGATGKVELLDFRPKYEASMFAGLRLKKVLGGTFTGRVTQGFFEENDTAVLVEFVPGDELTIDDSIIIGNTSYGVRLIDTEAVLHNNVICFNGVDGVRVEGDSLVTVSANNVLGQNGEHEVHSEGPFVNAGANFWDPTPPRVAGPVLFQPFSQRECDFFPTSLAKVRINTPLGSETVTLTGPTTVLVDISNVADTDGNSREQVRTELAQLGLTGKSALFGPVSLSIRDRAGSTGEIEETKNNTPGVLDIPPFTSTGSANSFFDVFFQIEAPNAPSGLTVLHNNTTPTDHHLSATITRKPPRPGETYRNPALTTIELFDENNNPTGMTIGPFFHVPDGIIQESFTLETKNFMTTPDTTGCPDGFAGKFSFDGTLTNKNDSPPFSDLVIKVRTLTNGNLLQNADVEPNGEGATLTLPERVVKPGESVGVPFVICLTEMTPFNFFVDVLGAKAE